MSILFSMIALMLLMAVALFIYAVISAPDGAETAEGFVLETGTAGQLAAEKKNRLQAGHGGMAVISVANIAGS
jgi:hypothetical protein